MQIKIKIQMLIFIIRSNQEFLVRGPGPFYFRGRPSHITNNNMITAHIHNRGLDAINVNNDMTKGGLTPLASFAHRSSPRWLGPATSASV